MTVRGAESVGAAMRRLDRIGQLRAGLDGAGVLGVFEADPLSRFAEADVGGATLEAVLAALAGSDPVAVGGGELPERAMPSRRRPTAMARVAEVTRAERAAARTAARDGIPAGGGPAGGSGATAPSPPARVDSGEPTSAELPPAPSLATSRTLSTAARAGARTRVHLPTAHDGRTFGGPPVVPRTAAAAPATAVPGSPQLQDVVPVAGTLPAAPAPGAATPESDRLARPADDRTRVALEGTARAPSEPVAGLAGLVSWWDAQAPAANDSPVGGLPAAPGRSAAWSVDQPAREPGRSAEGAFEGSPVVQLSLRSALEELLLAEARAAGIEVDP